MTDQTGVTLIQTRIAGGVWEGLLAGAEGNAPALEARHQDRALDGVELVAIAGKPGSFAVRVPIPASVLCEGVQTVLLHVGGKFLGQFTVISGVPLEEDLRAEISLLRAELDLLKRAFQRHCAEKLR
ncbi:hypothetical protein [Tabrizicola sp.]|uniref:hypothetical protein n=1 Tax=Tabrizicola sp. TaxID=2005166 RepID=UPI00263304EC|nr:hypothetical protein [Tabrizicola sp.]MDM7932612.1 hypothetical protein [Tabrizicola sp.]